MTHERPIVEQLNSKLMHNYPDQFRSGWCVIDYRHYESTTEPYQITVCKGRLITADSCWTVASLSPEEALCTAMLMVQS